MPQRQLEATLAQELGDNWREEVAEFEDVPVAAASIGQVGAPMDATRTHGPIGGRWVRTHSRQTPLSWQVHPFAADTPFMAGAPRFAARRAAGCHQGPVSGSCRLDCVGSLEHEAGMVSMVSVVSMISVVSMVSVESMINMVRMV